LLLPDSGGDGIASLEQLAVQRDAVAAERMACVQALLERAHAEAAALQQSHMIVQALPAHMQLEGTAWLEAAGFAAACETTPARISRAMKAGAMFKSCSL